MRRMATTIPTTTSRSPGVIPAGTGFRSYMVRSPFGQGGSVGQRASFHRRRTGKVFAKFATRGRLLMDARPKVCAGTL